MVIPERLFLKKPTGQLWWDARVETKREIPWRETLSVDDLAYVACCEMFGESEYSLTRVVAKLAKLLDEMQGTPITPRGR